MNKIDENGSTSLKVESEQLNRGLKSRHIQMIAIGGSVGVGIFLASAKMIQLAGPAILLAYAVVGLMIYFIMRSLGEMAVHKPISGSFSAYANDYLGNYMGYLTGWSYWLLWCFGVMAETIAIGNYMKYWFHETVPGWVWAFCSLFILTLINLINVKLFGEIEFWFSIIKVVTILALIAVGFVIIAYAYFFGGFPDVGFSNLWIHGGFFPKGFKSILMAIGPVSIAFIGVESIGLTAGETQNPSETLPKAIDSVLFRVLLFYIGSLMVIMSLFPWNRMSESLNSVNSSPFVLTFDKIGLKSAAGIINFVILTAAFSACNSGIFSSSRMLLNLKNQKNAPSFLGKINAKKIPVFSVLFSAFFMLIGVLIYFIFPSDAFQIVFSMCGIAGFFIWIVILITQLKFRSILSDDECLNLKYKSPLFPVANYIGLLFLGVIVFTCLFDSIFRTTFYIFIAWIVFLTLLYFVKTWYIDNIKA